MMTFDEFHNGLRILLNLDMHELVDAGVIEKSRDAFGRFSDDPFRVFIRADDETAEKIWALMLPRMKKRQGETP